MLLLTMIIYRISTSAASHSTTLSVGKTKAKTKITKPKTTTKKVQGCYVLPLISLAVFKTLRQITPTPTPLLADIISVIKSAKAQLKSPSLTGFSSLSW